MVKNTWQRIVSEKKIESLNECSFRLLLLCLPLKRKNPETKVSENELSYEAQKELNEKIKQIGETNCGILKQKIEKLETEIGEVEADMATPEGAWDMALYEKHQKLKKDLDQTVEEWETVYGIERDAGKLKYVSYIRQMKAKHYLPMAVLALAVAAGCDIKEAVMTLGV